MNYFNRRPNTLRILNKKYLNMTKNIFSLYPPSALFVFRWLVTECVYCERVMDDILMIL